MIYLDHNATTPLRREVREVMAPFLEDRFGNASSAHGFGRVARAAVERARRAVAAGIAAPPSEVVFTSGGTESNNLALFGTVADPRAAHLVVSRIEHASVIAPVRELEHRGARVTWVPVDDVGRIAPRDVAAALRPDTTLVSIGWANNEIGTVQPLEAIAEICRLGGVRLHVDAVQALGKIPVSVTDIDLCSLSAHKIGGPAGVGALFVRRGMAVRPLLFGGGQERGTRPGTENVAALVGFGAATEMLDAAGAPGTDLRERLWAGVARLSGVRRNSAVHECLANTLNISIDGARGDVLVAALDIEGVAVSVGSACAVGAGQPSHVLQAIGRSEDEARDGVRFSLGRETTAGEIDATVDAVTRVVERMRDVGRSRVVNG